MPSLRYLGLNSLLNLLNRWALGLYGLRFPLVMTASHMIFGSCALSPMMMLQEHYSSKHRLVIQNEWKGLAVIACMNGFQIACNNASLTVMELSMNQVSILFTHNHSPHMSHPTCHTPYVTRPVSPYISPLNLFFWCFSLVLSLVLSLFLSPTPFWPYDENQVIRATVPVLVACLAICIEAKVPSKGEICCLFVISVGVMMAVWEESRNAYLGILLTMTSTVMQSIQMSVSGRLMSGRTGTLYSFQMTFYTGPVAFITLLPFAIIGEFNIFFQSVGDRPLATIGFLLGSCCVAVVYNVVLFQAVRTLSSVGTAVLGNVKIVCLLMLSSVILGELQAWSANQYLGCFITFIAAGFYSYFKATAAKKPPIPVQPTAEAQPLVPKRQDT